MFVCSGAGVCSGECRPGAKQCQGTTPRLCGDNGLWQNMTPCTAICSNGACTGDCSPGSKQCMGNAVQTCSSAGRWVASETCMFVCRGNGECSGQCVPGRRQCAGTTPQLCSADGQWMNTTGNDCLKQLGAGCGTGNECVTGNCVMGCAVRAPARERACRASIRLRGGERPMPERPLGIGSQQRVRRSHVQDRHVQRQWWLWQRSNGQTATGCNTGAACVNGGAGVRSADACQSGSCRKARPRSAARVVAASPTVCRPEGTRRRLHRRWRVRLGQLRGPSLLREFELRDLPQLCPRDRQMHVHPAHGLAAVVIQRRHDSAPGSACVYEISRKGLR